MEYKYGTDPYPHQREGFNLSAEEKIFGLLMDMGTGKSKLFIDTYCHLYLLGKIQGVIVIAPNGVDDNWVVNEIPIHTPDYINYKIFQWQSSNTKKFQKYLDSLFDFAYDGGLPIFVVNVESFQSNSTKSRAFKYCIRLLSSMEMIIGIDESTRIKTPSSKRTKNIQLLGKRCTYKRILTGQPVAQNPLDCYSQFNFLSKDILGFQTYSGFKNYFAEIIRTLNPQATRKQGKEVYYDKIIAYRNLDELKRKIQPYCYVVKSEDCLDLPPKIYKRRRVELNADQKRMYNTMRDEYYMELIPFVSEKCDDNFKSNFFWKKEEMSDDEFLAYIWTDHEMSNIIAQCGGAKRIKLHQVLGGFAKTSDGCWSKIGSDVPRIKDLLTVIDETSSKIIIWTWFNGETEAVYNSIVENYGGDSVGIYGGSDRGKRIQLIDKFQDIERTKTGKPKHKKSKLRFFISKQSTGGIGLTLTKGQIAYYYNRDYSLESRVQSEKRNNRIGAKGEGTLYIDPYAPNTVDEELLKNQKYMRTIADYMIDFNATEKDLHENLSDLNDWRSDE